MNEETLLNYLKDIKDKIDTSILIDMLRSINEKLTNIESMLKKNECTHGSDYVIGVDLAETPFASYSKKAKDIVRRIGIPAQFKGHPLIIRAIVIMAEEPDAKHKVTSYLYEKLATEFSLPATQVERNIRHAIEHTLEFGNKELIKEIFAGFPKFTNSYFLATLADYISD